MPFSTTENNCIYEEGAKLIWSGTGFYMNLKDEFFLPAKTTCNVIAKSNVELEWLSSQLYAKVWVQTSQYFAKEVFDRRKAAIDKFEEKKAKQRADRQVIKDLQKKLDEVKAKREGLAKKLTDEVTENSGNEDATEFAPNDMSPEETGADAADDDVSDVEPKDDEAT